MNAYVFVYVRVGMKECVCIYTNINVFMYVGCSTSVLVV